MKTASTERQAIVAWLRRAVRSAMAFIVPLSVAMTALHWLVTYLNAGRPVEAFIGFGLAILGSFAANSFFDHLKDQDHGRA